MQNRTGRTGQEDQRMIYVCIPEQDRKNRTGRNGQIKRDTQNRSGRTGYPEQDIQNRTGRTGQAERCSQNRTDRTGQAERDRQNGTGRTGQAEQFSSKCEQSFTVVLNGKYLKYKKNDEILFLLSFDGWINSISWNVIRWIDGPWVQQEFMIDY